MDQLTNFKNAHRKIKFTTKDGLKGQLFFVQANIVRVMVNSTGNFNGQATIPKAVDIPTLGDETVASGSGAQKVGTPLLTQDFLTAHGESSKTGLNTDQFHLEFDQTSGHFTINDETGKVYFKQNRMPTRNKEKTHLSLRLPSTPETYYFGGGMQNGKYSLKGKEIAIENTNRWTDGGVTSPEPFFFTTSGYGILFNTFTKGRYDFSDPRFIQLTHEDPQLDYFVILGETPAKLIHGYHKLTGLPPLNPLYSFYPAHLNAYNRDYWFPVSPDSDGAIQFPDGKTYKEYQPLNPKSFNTERPGKISFEGQTMVPNVYGTGHVSFTTVDEQGDPVSGVWESLNGENKNYQFSARAIIDRYHQKQLPLGWFLPNDGYGAGYGQTDSFAGDLQNLSQFSKYAHEHGVATGLWTQEQLVPPNSQNIQKGERNLAAEAKVGGISAIKTDVAWVGAGYTFGLNGIAKAAQTLTAVHKKRPFILTVDGWAGTQRFASVWTGDQAGSDWQNIRFQIPTYLSAGLSGNSNIGSDIDGIYSGDNPVIQTRDLQWKSFTPLQLVMDGWGSRAKDLGSQFGANFLAINRFYLKLKTRLLPYLYSLAFEARTNGAPIVRPTFWLEASDFTYGGSLNQQFLCGNSLLIAPIFENYQLQVDGTDLRASLYLPDAKTTWYDFFSGDAYEGGQTISDFEAPLWKLPLFVKAGAILPLANATEHPDEIDKSQVELLIYPGGYSTFVLYEDDGKTTNYLHGERQITKISQQTTLSTVKLIIAAAKGTFAGSTMSRQYNVLLFLASEPTEVWVNGKRLADADYHYGPRMLEKFTMPSEEKSDFAQTEINQGNFLVVSLKKVSVKMEQTIRVVL